MKYIAGLILLAAQNLAFANIESCENSGSRLHAGYINGMITTLDRALINFNALEEALDPTLSTPGQDVKWVLHYNNDEAAIDQIEQLIDQKLDDEVQRLYAIITSFNSSLDYLDPEAVDEDLSTVEELKQSVQQWYTDFVDDIEVLVAESAMRVNDEAWLNDEDLSSMVSNIKADIDTECRKVLLLPHSQGNFYANAIWPRIYGETSNGYPINAFKVMGQLSLGAPTSQIGGGLASEKDDSDITAWINHDDDIILNLMNLIGLSSLEGNTSIVTDDISAHGLIDTFLGSAEISAVVQSGAASIASALEPMPLARTGIGSSSLQEVGYNDFDSMLDIRFTSDGTEYRYYGVPQGIYNSLLSAESSGAYFNANIRDSFEYYRFR